MDKIKYDAEYISYVESGESAAVFVTRDIVRSIDTTGMWIDITELDGYKNKNGRWEYEYYICELFPRKRRPVYPKDISEEDKKYITWQTAHTDICEQREAGYRGTRFRVCPKLVNRNRGTNRKPRWDYDILSIKRLRRRKRKEDFCNRSLFI